MRPSFGVAQKQLNWKVCQLIWLENRLSTTWKWCEFDQTLVILTLLQKKRNVTQEVFPVNCIVQMSRARKVDHLVTQSRSETWLLRRDDLLCWLPSDDITSEVSICVWGRLVSAFNATLKSFPCSHTQTINLNINCFDSIWHWFYDLLGLGVWPVFWTWTWH